MWPFRKKKIAVTTDEFVAALLEFRKKDKKDFLAELQKQAEQNWKLETGEITVMANEVVIADLWILSKALMSDKRVLDVLHDKYFSIFVNLGKTQEEKKDLLSRAQSDLHERYDVYYKAWEADMKPDHWMNLASEMARFFFPNQVNPGLNAFLTFVIHTRYFAFFVSICKFRSNFQIVDP